MRRQQSLSSMISDRKIAPEHYFVYIAMETIIFGES